MVHFIALLIIIDLAFLAYSQGLVLINPLETLSETSTKLLDLQPLQSTKLAKLSKLLGLRPKMQMLQP